MKIFGIVQLGLLLTTIAGCAVTPPNGIAIENVTVIDAVNGERSQQRIIIAGDRIVSVRSMDSTAPRVATTVDGKNRYVIPGLWDMHVHFVYEPDLQEPMADLFLRYGVTSVRDTGGNFAQLTQHRESLRARQQPTPRVFLSGPLLDGKRVVYDGSNPARPALGTSIPDAATAEQIVSALVEGGADFIKIYEMVHPDVFDALVTAAKRANVPIAAHVPLSLTADTAGPQVGSMEHLRNIELSCAANWQRLLENRRGLLKPSEANGHELRSALHRAQRLPAIEAYDADRCREVLKSLTNTIQVPTLRLNALRKLPPYERADWQDAFQTLPKSVQDAWSKQIDGARAASSQQDHRFADWSLATVGRMRDLNVPIGAGTDTPIGISIPGYSLHTELEMLVLAGLSPIQALHSATITPAGFFGRTDEGQIAPGMRADLVLLERNPLENITNTRTINRVMVGGRWVNLQP